MKIKQLTSYPNPNELGLGNTNETYIRVENSIDVSDIFPINTEVSVADSQTGRQYFVKAKFERTEFRINKLGQLYRDYNVRPGDEIKFTFLEKGNERAIFFKVTNYKRVFLSVGPKGTEVVNFDNLAEFSQDASQTEYKIPINEGELLLKFVNSEKKRLDSPNETDFYSSKVNGVSLSKGNYYITIGENYKSLEEVKKNAVEEYNLPDALPHTYVPQISNRPLQQIFYGAPGTGKSHKTNEVTSEYPRTVRTTFHPDSDYSTFVGAYKPTMEEVEVKAVPQVMGDGMAFDTNRGTYKEKRITYKYVKQAFLKAYVKAWKLFAETCREGVELKPQFLVIEEINRGNCAQIFGDLFQLLDRKNGMSEYPIEADEDIRKALLEEEPEDGLSFGGNGLVLSAEQKQYIDRNFVREQQVAEKVCRGQLLLLPPNLYIWATMNTSDQSLFPIDSAFKRRWAWRYIKITDGRKGWKIQGDVFSCDWWTFIQEINKKIASATSSDDKKLGYFFCKPRAEETVIDVDTFVNKVIFYLWNDVFKDNDTSIFDVTMGSAEPSFDAFYKENEDGETVANAECVKKFLINVVGTANVDESLAGAAEEDDEEGQTDEQTAIQPAE